MQEQIDLLLKTSLQAIEKAETLADIESIRTSILGKKGSLTDLLRKLGTLSQEERSVLGNDANNAKQELIEQLKQRAALLTQAQLAKKLTEESIDVTLPGRISTEIGSIHPVSRVIARIEALFASIGFTVVQGPEIDNDYNNFAALNIAADHPARSMHDTFYFDNGLLLRTHTSNLQNRVLKNMTPPLRVIIPGRVYRCDYDQTHTPMFHQLEGVLVDEQCTFSDLKGLLQDFLNQFFERESEFRFRPSYFPFTEPSAEMDMACHICARKGCRVCGHTGWLEVLGCGMVHPNVLRMGGIDPERYNGFAFGVGIDRFAMLRYGIDDLRKLFENDIRFLEQMRFA